MAEGWRARIAGSELWQTCKAYLGTRRPRNTPIRDLASLGEFISARAAHIAQSALYGYLRTRAGTRYPELFESDEFVASMNVAKWHVWIACVSDLAVYAGALLARDGKVDRARVRALVLGAVDGMLAGTGVPPDSGPEFATHVSAMRKRLEDCDWREFIDEEAAFSESPAALVTWAPIVDELKRLDAEIVRNSVRFRWPEVRSDLRRNMDCGALLACAASSAPEFPPPAHRRHEAS